MQHVTQKQMLALLDAARRNSERDWLAILVGFWHGLRATEIVGGWLKKKDCEPYFYPGITRESIRDGYITVQRLKGSLKTTQPLITHVQPLFDEKIALTAWVRKFGPNESVFRISRQRFWRIMQTHCSTAGIPKHLAHPHILKHSIAMQTIESAGIENVRTYLGHKSISSTGAYLKVDDDVASRAIAGAFTKS